MRARAKSQDALEAVPPDPSVVSQSVSSPFPRGAVVAGKYVVERMIGIGGVGLVLAARHLELDELVAIKVLRTEALAREELVRRFSREAKAAVRIKSEHAARVYDVGVLPDKGPYMVMEYLEGKDLGALTDDKNPLPVKRAVEFIMQACEAIAVAHSLGIIHRDIKPENLFLATRPDGSEVVKVLDFGISKTALTGSAIGGDIAMDRTQDLMGSPFYMSPEQFRGTGKIDHRTDIWSLGVVLYELLTCTQPFDGESVPAVCSAVLEGKPKPLAAHIRDVPPGLQEVLDRCLEKDPEKRFPNVAELAIALLPFAPTFARVLAERASGVLHASDRSIVTFKYDSTAPPSSRNPGAPTDSIPLAPPVPSMSTLTSGHLSQQPLSSTSPEALQALATEAQRTRRVILGVAAGAALLMVGGAFFAVTRDRAPAARSEPAPPPAVVAGTHAVSMQTEPAGARVEWKGRLLGETPATFHLPPGEHEVTVSRDGFRAERVAITVVEGAAETQQLRLTLKPEPTSASASLPKAVKAPALHPPVAGPPAKPTTAPARGATSAVVTAAAETPPPPPPASLPAAPPPTQTAKARLVEDNNRIKILDDNAGKGGRAPLVK